MIRRTCASGLEPEEEATVLHAIEVPEEGGNTEFTSLYLAYEALPDETRESQRSPAPLPLAMLASLPTPNRISSTENCPRSDRQRT